MSRCRDRLAAVALAALVTSGIAVRATPAAAQSPPRPGPSILDLTIPILDLETSIESLDTGVIDSQSNDEVQLVLNTDVLFAFDKATLSPKARAALEEVARKLRGGVKGTIRIDGYTDAKGSDAYNRDLSRRRADAVHRGLAPLVSGLPIRFQVAGHGEEDPVAANTNPDGSDNPKGRAKNRRVTITFAR